MSRHVGLLRASALLRSDSRPAAKALCSGKQGGGGVVILSNYFQDLQKFERADPELGLTTAFTADTK